MEKIYNDLINLFLASVIAAFCIALFKIENYFYYLFPCLLFFFLTYFVKRIVSQKFLYYDIESKFLSIKRFWFSDQSKIPFPFPIGIFFALFFSLISYGGIQILALLGYEYKEKIGRIRKKYRLREQDLTTISVISLLSGYLLLLIFYISNLDEFAKVIVWLLFSCSLPFGSLEGSRIFHANWILWIFYFSLFSLSLILVNITQKFMLIILALIFAILIALYFLYKYIK
ncbi:MAG: hypothetical protein QXO12_00755 [Candidatus Pacearchaeota archaeon]